LFCHLLSSKECSPQIVLSGHEVGIRVYVKQFTHYLLRGWFTYNILQIHVCQSSHTVIENKQTHKTVDGPWFGSLTLNHI